MGDVVADHLHPGPGPDLHLAVSLQGRESNIVRTGGAVEITPG